MRVGVIADDFSRVALAYEWDQVLLDPVRWREQVRRVDMVFVESAWNGNGGAWQYYLTGPTAPRPAIVELAEWCRAEGVPTVFWNKEDPVHFEDFIDTAALMDWVFTTDSNCQSAYRERLGHDRVGLMAFGVQDVLCNPVYAGPGTHGRGMAFMGTYFAHKFPERRQQMEVLFPAALAVSNEHDQFDIYSRFLGGDDRYQFPAPYDARVQGSLDFSQVLSAYRAYKVFLNVNSVTDSPTMCARRVLEITACGSAVVTTPTPAIGWYVGEGARQVTTTADAESAIRELLVDAESRERMVHLGQRELWRHHTFSHRVDEVCRAVGLVDHVMPSANVSVLLSTRRPDQLSHVLDQLACQIDVELQVLLGAHCWTVTSEHLALAEERGIHLTPVELDENWTLGECLNALKSRAECDLVAKMDDDDFYGPNYLADLWSAQRFSGADILGKSARYVYLEGRDETVFVSGWGSHRFTPFVAGPTLTMTRELSGQLDFGARSTGEDTQFLRDAASMGARIYASDPFNFLQWRAARVTHHTWQVGEDEFADSTVVGSGPRLREVTL